MDEFFDHILSSPQWVDMSGQANGMPSDSMGAFQGTLKHSTMPLMPSSQISGSLASQGQGRDVQDDSSAMLAGGNAPFPPSKTLLGTPVQRQQEVHDPVIASPVADCARHDNRSPTGGILTVDGNQENVHQSLQRLVEHNAAGGSLGLQLNTSGSVTPQGSASQFLPTVGGSSRAAMTLPDSASGGSSSSEASGFQQPLGDSHSPPPAAPLWSQSYTGVSPLPSAIGQGKLEAFGLHGENIQAEGHHLGKRSHREENVLARENRSVTTEHDDLQGTLLTSYTGGQVGQTSLARSSGTQTHQQNLRTQTLQSGEGNSAQQYGNHSAVSQLQSVAGGGGTVNGAARPRVRARRGQATDPHSIAERLRRERIAERMKSLQELVPNSNKTDKASMLDEIIEYVKFLQLQVKVLSMSRLGGAGAVAPLIADVPAEGSGSLMSAALGQAGVPLAQSQDALAFEQEVAKLMESNMTTAMQYLQNKGLCLMPIALATAISSSSGKPLLASVPTKGVESANERHKTDLTSVVLPLSSSSVAVGLAVSSSGGDTPVKDNSTKKDAREEGTAGKSNGTAPGLPSDVPKVVTKNSEEPPRRGQ